MDAKLAEQMLEELVPTLEALDTQSTAIIRFLKDKGITTDEELAPYLEQAASASSVRWRAVSVRMRRLFSLAAKEPEKKTEEKSAQGSAEKKPSVKPEPEKLRGEPSVERARQEAQTKPAGSRPQPTQKPESTKASGESNQQKQDASNQPKQRNAA